MIQTDLKLLEDILKGNRKEICCVYGEPASGKTTLVKEAAIFQSKNGKKVVFIDSEKTFNTDRLMQLCGNKKEILKNIFVLKPKNLKEQRKYLKKLLKLKDLDLVIIDSVGFFHRYELKKDSVNANKELHKQCNILSELCSKGTAVMITNQVYEDIENKKINLVGGSMLKNWSKCLLKLEKNPRKLILEKPRNKEVAFKIIKEGLV
ncbi:MAG: AAA family ATPase [Nanoarchaeota archaeon]|nr:AAA family ATPase [Nanoarchaeota archaeon]